MTSSRFSAGILIERLREFVKSVSRGGQYSGLEHCHHFHLFRVRMKKDGYRSQVEIYEPKIQSMCNLYG